MNHPNQHSPIHSNGKFNKQRGAFDPITVLIVLIVMAVLAALVTTNFSGDTSKATALLNNMKVLSDNLQRAKMDMGCFPSRMAVLWNQSSATAANMYCGLAGTNTWSGPYTDVQTVDATTNAVLMPTVGDGIAVNIAREAGGNLGQIYYLRSTNVPNGIVGEALKKCNGNPAATATFATASCRGSLNVSGETGTFDVRVQESR